MDTTLNSCCGSVRSRVRLFATPGSAVPGLPVPHHLLKFAQIHVCCIGDAIQSFHPLTHSSTFSLKFSQHQGLFH